MEAGFARVEITPPVGPVTDLQIPFLGPWWQRYAEFERVQDPLHARAMVVKDEGGGRVAVVSVDSLGDGVEYGDHARELIAETTGIRPDQVMILDTHAWSTPDTLGWSGVPLDRRWANELGYRIAAAVERASKECAPVRADVLGRNLVGATQNQRSEAGPWQYEGRLGRVEVPQGPIDPEMWVLRFLREDGKISGAMLNFGCQPLCLQSKPVVSADFVGVALERMEREGDSMPTVLFANGAAGNVIPLMRGHVGLMRWVGQKVGDAARSLLRNQDVAVRCELKGPVRMWRRTVTVRRRSDVPSREEIAGRLRELLVAVAEEAGDVKSKRSSKAWQELRHWQEMDKVALMPGKMTVTVQVLRLGGFTLIGVSGNLFCELGLEIKAALPECLAAVAGFANGCGGYIAPRGAYETGGYEVEPSVWSPFEPGVGEMIRDEIIAMAKAVCRDR